jgi:hypothetical protein
MCVAKLTYSAGGIPLVAAQDLCRVRSAESIAWRGHRLSWNGVSRVFG